jgi:hypothetical protein
MEYDFARLDAVPFFRQKPCMRKVSAGGHEGNPRQLGVQARIYAALSTIWGRFSTFSALLNQSKDPP